MTDRARHHAGPSAPTGRSGTGFTLIEVLVVIFILGILAAIIASVAGYVMNSASRRETEATQKALMQAVQAFYDAGSPKAYPDPIASGYPPGLDDSGWALVNILTGKNDPGKTGSVTDDKSQTPPAKAGTELLLKLPEDAWKGGWNEPVKDAWGVAMRYEAAGGLGGKPVVISAGADGRFGKDDPGHTDDATKEEDNIRSDESQ